MLLAEPLFCALLIALAISMWRRREAVLSISVMLGVIVVVALWFFLPIMFRDFGPPIVRDWVMPLSPSAARRVLIYMMAFEVYAAGLAIHRIFRQNATATHP